MRKPNNKKDQRKPQEEFEQKMIDLSRVTRVTKGGKQLSFRALVVIGDGKGRVAYGVSKGKDVSIAIGKAVDQAKKRVVKIPFTTNGSIAHEVRHKFNSAQIMLKPAPKGSGVKAGGPVRAVLSLAGAENIIAKMMGSKNKINNVKCTYEALTKVQPAKESKKQKTKEQDKTNPEKPKKEEDSKQDQSGHKKQAKNNF